MAEEAQEITESERDRAEAREIAKKPVSATDSIGGDLFDEGNVVETPNLERIGNNEGYLSDSFAIDYSRKIDALSSEFASAFAANEREQLTADREIYALLFDAKFPVRMLAMDVMKRADTPHLIKVLDSGKVMLPDKNNEAFAVVLERPQGITLTNYMLNNNRFSEKRVTRHFLGQLLNAIQYFTLSGTSHGRINPDNIYIDVESSRVQIGECLSEFYGYSQSPVFEPLENMVCDPTGKNEFDMTADYFALGMVLIFLFTGRLPFEGMSAEAIIRWRLDNGSSDNVLKQVIDEIDNPISRRMDSLLKGLLSDDLQDRWKLSEVRSWLRMEDVMSHASKLHKEASTALVFDGEEYFSPKKLAYDLHRKWPVAKRQLRVAELTRWLNLALKRPEQADMIEALVPTPVQEIILSDEKLARIIIAVDPSGPLRFHGMVCMPSALGSYLANIYINGEREKLQYFGFILNDGILQYWINRQKEPDLYSYGVLGWSPLKIRQNIRKNTLGFGMERTLYDLNPSLACQSKLLQPYYAANLYDAVIALNKYQGNTDEVDPLDRHLSAFLAAKIGLSEEMTVKNLKNYPSVSKNPHVLMLGLLSVAQKEAKAPPLHTVSDWMLSRLSSLDKTLHSSKIRDEMKRSLKKASRSGILKDMYLLVASSMYVKKDNYGFKKAREEYRNLALGIGQLKRKKTIQNIAYATGLKVSVNVAYVTLAVTIFYVLLRV